MPSVYQKVVSGKKVRGVWYIQLEAGTKADGSRKRIVRQFKGTKKEAEDELARLLTSRKSGQWVDPSKETLAAYLRRWLEHVEDSLAPSTHHAYTRIIEQRWIPTLGETRLQALQTTDISAVERVWRRNGRIGRPRAGLQRALSAKTVLNFHRVLQTALAQAVAWKLIVANPADDDHMEPPRAPKAETRALGLEDASRLLAAINEDRYGTALHTLLATGLRSGEVLGLRWRDIDLEAGVVRVAQQYDRVSKTYRDTKTHRSRRPVEIDATLIAALKAYRARQGRITELVFTDARGRGLNHGHLGHALDRCIERAGLEHLGPHGLRHTHASLLIGLGAHMKVIQERLGHASYAITADTYSHVQVGAQRAAAELLGVAITGGEHAKRGPQ